MIYLGIVDLPTYKIVINLPRPIRCFIVKENRISSVVNEILWYRHTQIMLHSYKDVFLHVPATGSTAAIILEKVTR